MIGRIWQGVTSPSNALQYEQLLKKESIIFDGQRWSNADTDRIELSDPESGWPAMFAAEAEQIRSATT